MHPTADRELVRKLAQERALWEFVLFTEEHPKCQALQDASRMAMVVLKAPAAPTQDVR